MLLAATGTSCVSIIIKKIKSVHSTVVNTVFAIELTLIAVPVWWVNRYMFNEGIEYNFTAY